MLTVHYFARLREVFGVAQEQMSLPEPANIEALLERLRSRGEPWASALAPQGNYRVAVNQTMANGDESLHDGDEVALFPPVTGG